MPPKKMKTDTVENLIEDAINDCKPTKLEEIQISNIANKIKNKIETYISTNELYFVKEVVFGGSFAKGTWLKNHADIDIFIKFDRKVSINDFENFGKKIGLHALREFSPYFRHADHPYVEAFAEGTKVDIVPCFDVLYGYWKSAADRSPFHTSYVINHLDENKKNHVRLLKKFLKSLNIYGAEISTQGFSGYVSEILIIKFGSFLSTLQYFSNYSADSNVISIENHNLDSEKLKKFTSFLIMLDPVDENRNLGSAISSQSIATLIQASRRFLRKPSNDFFINVRKTLEINDSLKNLLSSNILILEFKYTFRPPDMIWGQLKKAIISLSKFIESYGFKILKSHCYADERENCVMVFLMDSVVISRIYSRNGPEIFRGNDLEKFIESNLASYLKWIDHDTRTKCILFREFTDIKEYLKFVFKNKQVMIGIPKGLIADFFSTVKISTLDQQQTVEEHVKKTIFELLNTDVRLF